MTDTKLDVQVAIFDEPTSKTIASASVKIDDLTVISRLRVIAGEDGLFVTMPQRRESDDVYRDVAFPLTGELRKEITDAVLAEHARVAKLAPEQRRYEIPLKGPENEKLPEDLKLDVKVYPRDNAKDRIKATASVAIDNKVMIRSIRINQGKKGLFVAMPQYQDSTNRFRDIAFPVNSELRKLINTAIIEKYERGEKSLAEGLRRGAEKAAKQSAAPSQSVDKGRKQEALG